MKIIFLTLIVASVNVSGSPIVKTWTFEELTDVIEKENTSVADEDPEKKPLFDAFERIMYGLYTGEEDNIFALLMSPTGSKLWTIDQLKQALADKHTNPDLLPSITSAHEFLNYQNSNGKGPKKETTEVPIPALDISTWTLQDVLTALEDPQTDQELIPYLKNAQEQFEEAKNKGQKKEYVYLVTPVGLIPQADGVEPTIVHRSTIHEHNLLK